MTADSGSVAGEAALPLPSAIREGGRRGWWAALVAGAVLGAVALIVPVLLPREAAFDYLVVLLAMIAGVYLGFALADGRRAVFRTEYLGIVAFAAVATAALVLRAPLLLAAGYLGHGLWDAIHHPRAVDTAMPTWYVPLCIGFDVVVGVYVAIAFRG